MLRAGVRCGGVAWAVLVLAVAASPAGAAPTWLGAGDVATSASPVGATRVAVDPAGDAVAAWFELAGTGETLEVAARPAGGTWGAPTTLDTGIDPAQPLQVAMDAAGDAFVAWAEPAMGGDAIDVAERPAGASAWSAPVVLTAPGEAGLGPSLAVDAAGDAVVAWVQLGTALVRAAYRPAGASAWPAAVSLTAAGDFPAQDVDIALDAHGDAQAVWSVVDASSATEWIEGAARSSASGTWSDPVSISGEGSGAVSPQVTYDGSGDAIAAYGLNGDVWSAEHAAGASGWPPIELSDTEVDAPQIQLATDARGDTVVGWSGAVGVQASYLAAGSDAWTLTTLADQGTDPRVTLDAQGDAVATWLCQLCGARDFVLAAQRPATSGAWLAPAILSAVDPQQDAGAPALASDAVGDALAVWGESNGTQATVQADPYVGTGPELNGLAIPASGVAGQPVTFSVSPFDVWTSPWETFWSFGDAPDSGLLGTSVTHTYGAPGVYPVTVTSLDNQGNESTASGSVTIAPAPPPPAPAPGGGGTTGMIGVLSVQPTLVAAAAPELSGVSASPSRFRVGSTATAVSASATASGTSLRFTLSVGARLQIAITHTAAGVRSGSRCVARTRSTKATARACRRVITNGTLVRAHETAGRDRVAFTGRIGSHALAPGAYLASLTASDAAGHSRTVSVGLRVVR